MMATGEALRAAACTTVDPEIMLPGSDPIKIREAKQVCARCPLSAWEACYAEALTLSTHEPGVWAGTTQVDRRNLRRRRNNGNLPSLPQVQKKLFADF
jgi:hypothetical protein